MSSDHSERGDGNASMDDVSARFAKTVSGDLKAVANGVYLLPGFGNCTLIASEVLGLAGGAKRLLERANELAGRRERNTIQRALHLLDFVIQGGAPEADEARKLKADYLEARAELEDSFIARNILKSAAILERERKG